MSKAAIFFESADDFVAWPQSLKQHFINVSYHILVASLTDDCFITEPSGLDWLQVYDMAH